MKAFPEFDTLAYLSEEAASTRAGLDALVALGGVMLPVKKLSPEEHERYEERAAIKQFDGGMHRKDAEERAKREILSIDGELYE